MNDKAEWGRVIVDPHFRTMTEIFDAPTLDRLNSMADIVWARDDPMPSEDFEAEVADADAVVFGQWRHGRAGLKAAGNRLKALLEVAGGHGHVGLDYDAALGRGLHIGSCAPAFGPVVAEMGLALALAASRGVVVADRDMRRGSEAWLHEGNRSNSTLIGSTVGFVGCGGISRHLQAMLKPFGPRIIGYDPPVPPQTLRDRGIERSELEPMFDTADVIFVLAAPTSTSRRLVSARLMERLTPDQTLVVLSRASLVDFEAIVELSNERGFRFATDVYPEEPLAKNHPVRRSKHGIIVPHLAGALPAALRTIGRMVVDDLEAILKGNRPTQMQYLTTENLDSLKQTD